MLQGLKNVNFDDMDQMLPVSIMLIGMPISGSIGHAIGLGLISYAVVKLLSGKAKDCSSLSSSRWCDPPPRRQQATANCKIAE